MKTIIILGLASVAAFALPSEAAAQGCATSGSTFTTLAGGNGQQGNMFDMTPSVDMTLECVDIQWSNTTDLLDMEIWYTTGTSFGNETNPAVWTLLGSVSQVPADPAGGTTQLDISGNGVTFAAGQTYGIYVYNVNYPSIAGFLIYTTQGAGPTLYTGDHCDVLTNAGVFGFFGGTFQTRDFNGELHTELTGPAGPSIAVSAGAPGGSMTFDFAGYTASSPIAVLYGPAGSFTAPGGPCAGTTVDLLPINISNPIILFADANGDAVLTQNVPGGGAGLSVQAADVATCAPSNAIVL